MNEEAAEAAAGAPAEPGPAPPGPAGHAASCPCCSRAEAGGGDPSGRAPSPGGSAADGSPAPRSRPKADEAPAVSVRRLGVSVGRYDILRNVSLDVPRRGQTVVIGPNGAGKSTLVRAILGEIGHSGEIRCSPPRPRFGYVPQRLDFDRHLPITVAEFMALGRSRWPVWLGVPGKARQEILARLETVRAAHLFGRPLGSLSGGESQRVFLARALMDDPEILVLDEPATGVDVSGEQLLCEILEGFKSDFTVLMVSHDLAAARAHGDWIVCLNRTVVAEGPPSEIFRPEVISLAFGIHQSLLFSGGPGLPSFGARAPEGPAESVAGEGGRGAAGPAPEAAAPCGPAPEAAAGGRR